MISFTICLLVIAGPMVGYAYWDIRRQAKRQRAWMRMSAAIAANEGITTEQADRRRWGKQ